MTGNRKKAHDNVRLLIELLCTAFLMYLITVTLLTYMGLSAPIGFPVDQKDMTDFQIFTPLILGLIIYPVLSFLNRYPWLYSYIVSITPVNRDRQYRAARLLLTFSKLWILIVLILDFQYRAGYPAVNPGSTAEFILYITLGVSLFLVVVGYLLYSIRTG